MIAITIEKSYFTFTLLSSKGCITLGTTFRCMQRRTVIRSIISSTGSCFAYSDNTITWKSNNGDKSTTRLTSRVSVMLGIRNATGNLGKIAIGTETGKITILNIPSMAITNEFSLNSSKVRSIELIDEIGKKFLAGLENGEIWNFGDNVPNRSIKLFQTNGPITSIKLSGEIILAQQGWTRKTFDWSGEEIDMSKKLEHFKPKYSQRVIARESPKISAIM
ncbi:MAG: hypothetical protein CMB73_02590 [Euryarchaeota archaeon]|nr:hypothetical protein [Euryarchaeota archaeon]